MSLQRLRISLERLIPQDSADPTRLADLESLFLTSRQCSEKYQRLITEILNTGNSDEPADFEQTMMWFAFKNDKPSDESIFGEGEEKEEKWKKDWLDRMERRESVYHPQILCMILTISKGADSNHFALVPTLLSRLPSHRPIYRGRFGSFQEAKTTQTAFGPLA